MIYKLLAKVSLEEKNKQKKVKYNRPVELTIKRQDSEKKRIDYKSKIKKMAESDPQHVASIIKKWLKEK